MRFHLFLLELPPITLHSIGARAKLLDSRATGCPRFEPRLHFFFCFFAPAVAAVVAVDAIVFVVVFVVFGVVGVQNGVPRRLLKT